MKKIILIKDWRDAKVGTIFNWNEEAADGMVNDGYAKHFDDRVILLTNHQDSKRGDTLLTEDAEKLIDEGKAIPFQLEKGFNENQLVEILNHKANPITLFEETHLENFYNLKKLKSTLEFFIGRDNINSGLKDILNQFKEGIKPEDVLINNKEKIPEAVFKKDYRKKIFVEKIKSESVEVEESDDVVWRYDKEGNKKLNHLGIAKFLVQTYNLKTIGDFQKEIYYYDSGVYRSGGRNKILNEIQKLSGGYLKNSDVHEIVKAVERISIQLNGIKESPRNLINFKNGVLDIETGELKEHDKEYMFLHQIPFDYVKDADCPNINKFLKETLQEKDIPLIYEFLGFSLYRKSFIKKAFILLGERDTGKTTLIKTITTAIGLNNTCSVALHKICKDKFAASRFYGKLLNIYDDLSTQDIQDVGAFKVATGGGVVAGEKKFADSFEFVSYCKLLFACNKMSRVNDSDDDAFYSRWVIIQFLNNFSDRVDYNLDEKLTTEEEMVGFLSKGVESLKTLLKKGKFSTEDTAEEIKLFMEKNSNNISAFAYDCIAKEEGSYITIDNCYELYKLYCENVDDSPETKDRFTKHFPTKVHYLKHYTPELEVDGKKQRVKCYLNITLSNTCSDFFAITSKQIFDTFKQQYIMYKKSPHDYEKDATPVTQSENGEQTILHNIYVEEDIEDTSPETLIISFIKAHQDDEERNGSLVLEALAQLGLDYTFLEKLRSTGQIYQSRADHWRVLE